MNWEVHRELARIMWEAGVLDFDEFSEILTDLGGRTTGGQRLPLQVWVDEGWLTPKELGEGLRALENEKDSLSEEQIEELSTDEFVRAKTAFAELDEGLVGHGEAPSTFEEIRLDHEGLEQDTETAPEPGFGRSSRGSDTAVYEAPGGGGSKEKYEVRGTMVEENFALGFDKTGLFVPIAKPQDLMSGKEERYELGDELGRGGGGRVVDALDRLMGRHVAMKIYEAPTNGGQRGMMRFLAEAQATCQLEHPHIIPVYDVGMREDGSLYYTMLRVQQHSLEEVLVGLREGESEYVQEYSLTRLLSILKQVCQAIHYAHQKGVIHRDLKPANIMLGSFGEVWVMDWGLAYVLGGDVHTELSAKNNAPGEAGQTMGTPSYMSPEQAQGRLEEVDERSDIYSLGAILYQILCLEPPFQKDNPIDTMWSVVGSALIRPGDRERQVPWSIPEELERISLKALSREQGGRHQSGRELFDDLETFSGGVRIREAASRLELAGEAVQRFRENKGRIEALNQTIQGIRGKINPWDPIERKRELWGLQDEQRALQVERARFFGEALAGFQQALANDAGCEPAREGMADLYWERYCEAEEERNSVDEIYFRALLMTTKDERYLRRLTGPSSLRIETRPAGAEVTLFPYEELDRRLVVANAKPLGATPTLAEGPQSGELFIGASGPGASGGSGAGICGAG